MMNEEDGWGATVFAEPTSRRSIQTVREQPSFRAEPPSRGRGEPGSRRTITTTVEQGSRGYGGGGQILVGEVLSKNYDLSAVDAEDRSSVLATIHCIATLEECMPNLDISVSREPGYYAILVRGFDEFIDLVNWHNKVPPLVPLCVPSLTSPPKVRMTAGSGSHNKMRLVHNFLANPSTGILTVRVGMRETGMATEPGLPTLSVLMAPGSRKRGHSDGSGDDQGTGPKIDYGLAKSILESLKSRCNMDEVEGSDVHRLLTILYHVTMLDSDIPLLEVSPVRRDESGSYVMTCRGFIHILDFDQVYERLVAQSASDDALRTVLSVAYNTVQGTLELCVQGNRAAGPGKRRRAGAGPGE